MFTVHLLHIAWPQGSVAEEELRVQMKHGRTVLVGRPPIAKSSRKHLIMYSLFVFQK